MYITATDLLTELGQDRLVQLTDLDDKGEKNDDRISRAIEYAEETFNLYARTRYVIPIAPVDALVKGICIDLAVFHFYKNAELEEGVYTVRLRAHDRAIKKLENISRGLVLLNSILLPSPTTETEFTGSVWVPTSTSW